MMRAPRPAPARDWIEWPFFEPRHRALAERLDAFVASRGSARTINHDDVDFACRKLVRALGEAGLLEAAVAPAEGDAAQDRLAAPPASRARRSPGATVSPISPSLCRALAPGPSPSPARRSFEARGAAEDARGRMARGVRLSEKDAGSDVAAMSCAARLEGDHYVIDGEKTWISNGGIADVYSLFARTGEAPGARGLTAFVVFRRRSRFSIAERIEVIAPHPLATLRFESCRIPASRGSARRGGGFKVAMQTLDIFRASVAAAALGFARRALDEALAHAKHAPDVRRRRSPICN